MNAFNSLKHGFAELNHAFPEQKQGDQSVPQFRVHDMYNQVHGMYAELQTQKQANRHNFSTSDSTFSTANTSKNQTIQNRPGQSMQNMPSIPNVQSSSQNFPISPMTQKNVTCQCLSSTLITVADGTFTIICPKCQRIWHMCPEHPLVPVKGVGPLQKTCTCWLNQI